LVDDAFGGEGEHEAGEAAEDHAEADQCSDDPDGACRPGAPDHDGEDEGDDAVEEEPASAVAGTDLEEVDYFDDAFEEEVVGEDQGEDEQAVERMHDEDDAGDEIDRADEDLPDTAAGGVGFKSKDEVGDAAEDHGPAEEEGDGDSGEGRDEDGEETEHDEQNAEGDGPVDGLGGEAGEGDGGGGHGSPPEVVGAVS
jgi:hypothetical protein